MIRGIILDYGGTIDTRGEHWSEILWRAWQHAGIPATKELFRECYVYGERQLAAEAIIDADDAFYATIFKKALCQLERYNDLVVADIMPHLALGYAQLRTAAQRIALYCDRYAQECIDEARPALDVLAGRFPLALVSNFYGNLRAVLDDYGLSHYFQAVIESASAGVRKPDALIFEMGVQALGLVPGEVAVIGDSVKNDIMPARSLGCPTYWIEGAGWEERGADDASLTGYKSLGETAEAILSSINN